MPLQTVVIGVVKGLTVILFSIMVRELVTVQPPAMLTCTSIRSTPAGREFHAAIVVGVNKPEVLGAV